MIKLLIVIIFASIAAGYVAGFFVYRDYREKAAYLDSQTQFAMNKFGEMEGNLKELYVSLDNTVDKNSIEKKELLSKIEEMREDIKEWEIGYRATLLGLKKTIEGLNVDKLTRIVEKMQKDIDEFRVDVQDMGLKLDEVRGTDKVAGSTKPEGVDLGKISVKK